MAENHMADQLSRRRALKILEGTTSAAAILPVIAKGAAPVAGSVRQIARPAAELPTHLPQFFRAVQIRTLEAVSETIIPAVEHSSGARAARVWEYIDETVADADKGTKDFWTQGLAFLNGVAEQEHGKNFEDCTADLYAALVERISQNEDAPTRPEDRFFVTAKRATIDGYYASAIGIHQDLLYQGK